MDDDDQRQLDRVVALVRDVLGDEAVGAYLFGSAVLGGLRPESDLDVLAVTERPTTHEQKRRLVACLLAISGRSTTTDRRRRVELTVVVRSGINPWRYPPSFDFQYGDWLRAEFESGTVTPWPTTVNPDLASLVTMVRLADTALVGPAPADVFEPVPHDDLITATVGGIGSLLDDLDDDTRNVILTLARIWSTVDTGAIRSKDAAAEWALDRLPPEHREVVARARAAYLGEGEDDWDALRPRIDPHVQYVVGEIERATARRR